MRFIKKQFSLWRLVLIIGVAAIAIPIAAHVRATGIAVVNQRHENLAQLTADNNETTDAKHSKDSKAAVGLGVARKQDDDYYDRRREYWERRVERRLDDEENGDDNDDEDSNDNKASKADSDDDDDDVDEELERRRDYWRKRVERDW